MAKQTFTTGQVLTAAQMTSLQQTAMLGGAASAKTASYTLVAADAGTAISMSNASATTITVNTGLFAAGDTVQITNLAAGVCTITAGTATVNTSASLALAQYESGTLDFTSTSAAIFIKGAGAAAVSASGLTYVGGATFSASSAVNVNDVFSATYQNYIVYSTLTPSVGGTDLNIRLRVSGTDASSSNYTTQRTYVDNTTTSGNRYTVTEFSPFALGTDGNFFRGDFFSPFESVKTGLQLNLSSNTGTTMIDARASFSFNLTTSFTGFTVFPGSGNITGSIKVYGLANS